MSIPVQCSACGRTFEANDLSAGRKALCPRCAGNVYVPGWELPRLDELPAKVRAAEQASVSPCNRSPRRLWVWLAAGGGAALAAVTIVGAAMMMDFGVLPTPSRPPRPAPVTQQKPVKIEPAIPAQTRPKAEAEPAVRPPSKIAKTLEDVTAAIVKFEMPFPGGKTMGTGFLIDSRGWIATNHHVAASVSTAARVKVSTGQRLELAGIIALAPERDLAIVKLKRMPSQYMLLDITYRDRPKLGATVFTYGHPQNVDFSLSKGIVSRVLTTGELLADQPAHTLGGIKTPADELWIQTDAKMLPGSSGGPLLDEACRVLGINTFINRQTSYGFSSHVKYLKDLADRSSDKVTPLKPQSEIKPPPGFGTPPRIAVSKERIEELRDAAAAFAWKPRRAADYQTLMNLAAMMTVAKRLQAPADAAVSADQVFAQLKQAHWTDEQLSTINRYAVSRIHTPGHGTVFVGTVVGKGKDPRGKGAGLMLQLPGASELLLVPGGGELLNTRPGSRVLVLGIILAQTGQAEIPGRPEPQSFRVVQSYYLLPVK
jgi:S1-C subfamily serine protease